MSYLQFNTKNGSYIFDNSTGYVIPASKYTCLLIDNLENADCIDSFQHDNYDEKEHILSEYRFLQKCKKNGMFINNALQGSVTIEKCKKDSCNSNFSNLILIVTEDCNLRCRYCCYSDRYQKNMSFSKDKMSFETAKTSIDIFHDLYINRIKNGADQIPALTFYGGEPLLHFDLIKRVVKYCYAKFDKIQFNMTTNGLLLNEETIKFCVANGFNITFSLDGYKENHDRNRVTVTDKPSYDLVIKNIYALLDYKIENGLNSLTSFNCCFDEYTDLHKMIEYFESAFEKYDITKLRFIYSPVDPFDTDYYDWCNNQLKIEKHNTRKEMDELFEKYINNYYGEKTHPLISSFFNSYYVFLTRNCGLPSELMGNACVPTAKLAVYPKGEIALCEKMCKRHLIGNVSTGIDWEKVSQLCNDYIRAIKQCVNCSINKICSSCFIFFDEETLSINKGFCEREISSKKKMLTEIFTMIEHGLDVERIFGVRDKMEIEV